jgi:hypothetical protein
MKTSRVFAGAIMGAISGAIAEVCLVAIFLSALEDIYPPGVSTPSFTAGVAGPALLEGLVAGLLAGVIAGLIGRWAWLLVIAAAFVGFQSMTFWLLGGAAGGMVALLTIEVQRKTDRMTA